MRKMFFAAVVQLIALTLSAQGVVKGRVLDENGHPLQGATVTVNAQVQGCDAKGLFAFKELKLKKTILKISFIGYKTVLQTINVPFEGEFRLEKTSGMLQEVVVSSLRATDKSPVAYTNLDKETLSKNNLGQDIPYLISNTPSLVITSDAGTGVGYTNFRIRGTDASRINITINGIPYNDPDEQGAYWVDVPDLTSSVENMQIQRGVGTSTNGAAAFGANINMQTENYASKASGEISASYGSFNTQKTTVKLSSGLINNHWAIDSRLSSITSDGYIDRGWVNMKSYFVQAGYYGDKTTIKFLTFGGNEKTYHAWDGVPQDKIETDRTYNPCGYMGKDANGNPLYYQNQTDNYIQTNYQLLGVHTFSPELTLSAGLHYTRGDGYYEEYKRDQSFQSYSLKPFKLNDSTTVSSSDLVRQKKMSNDFAGAVFSLNYKKEGLTLQFGGALNNYWGKHWGDVIWVKNYIGDILPITEYYRSSVNKSDGNIYLKGNYEFSNKLNIYADFQFRQVNYNLKGTNDEWDYTINGMQILDVDKNFNFFNPKAGIFYRPDANNDVFASFAIANREPTRTNYTDGTANTWPTYETLYDGELGYKFHDDIFAFGANAYLMYYHNQLILTGKINDIGEMLTENIPTSYRAGIELMGNIKLTENLRWDASVTMSRNRILNFTEYVDNYDADWNWTGQQMNTLTNTPIAYSPDLTGISMITYSNGNFEAALQSQYVGSQFVDNTGSSDRMLDAYLLNNIRLSYALPVKGLQSLNFTLMLNNIFNEKYISNAWVYSYNYQKSTTSTARYNDFGYYPQAGRNFLLGMTVKF